VERNVVHLRRDRKEKKRGGGAQTNEPTKQMIERMNKRTKDEKTKGTKEKRKEGRKKTPPLRARAPKFEPLAKSQKEHTRRTITEKTSTE
jgi:hypothetical protein